LFSNFFKLFLLNVIVKFFFFFTNNLSLKTFVKNVTQNAQSALIKILPNAQPALRATLSNLVHLNVWNLKIVF
jgi:hypothetical protein